MRRVTPAGWAVLAIVGACCIWASVAGCKGPYDAAWRSLDGIQKARDLTAQQLANAADKQHKACLAKHKSRTAEFSACVRKHRLALARWQTIVRPAINSSIQITATAIDIAERVKGEVKISWLELIKPAACGLLGAAKAWGHWFADKGAALLAALTFAEGMVCR